MYHVKSGGQATSTRLRISYVASHANVWLIGPPELGNTSRDLSSSISCPSTLECKANFVTDKSVAVEPVEYKPQSDDRHVVRWSVITARLSTFPNPSPVASPF